MGSGILRVKELQVTIELRVATCESLLNQGAHRVKNVLYRVFYELWRSQLKLRAPHPNIKKVH